MSTVGIQPGEKSGREVYPDIIDLPHHEPKYRPRMSLYQRAAQFAPFAALNGYAEMIAEQKRETNQRRELDELEIEALNRKLSVLAAALSNGVKPVLEVTYFEPDLLKEGGEYVTVTDRVVKIDRYRRRLILDRVTGSAGSMAEIKIEEISDIQGEILKHLDDDFI